jgi:ribitol-5-phosphate 2-dehydrogenase (NADP+) / D-ribitol-5-phosphate cytidylyltransferase
MKYVAVILAGGQGKRLKSQLPKQFMKIGNKPLIQYSMEKFVDAGVVDEFIVVSHPDYRDLVPVEKINLSVPCHVIAGGSSRNLSTWHAIDFARSRYRNQETALIFQDAARPNPDVEVIKNIAQQLLKYSSVVAVNKVTDTVYYLDENNKFAGTADRTKLLKAHTPQAFRMRTIMQAYDLKQLDGNPEFSDDISIVKHYLPDTNIGFVEDSPLNFKVSFPEDFRLMKLVLGNTNN